MQLPDALQPWRPWLSWFAPELAAELGDLVRRLHPLLGRFQSGSLRGEPEPDGLGDLHRRGSYERLLMSEWLLADELPDEFLRRAASGEHLFLAPRPRARQADRLIVALFDTGPWQLGAPRLAQMAVWILLARRAAEAGGELRWGVWHEPGKLHPAQSATDLSAWLKQRSYVESGPEDMPRWQAWLADEGPASGEVWHVGASLAPGRREPGAPTHELRLSRALTGHAIEVQLQTGATQRAMLLPLPVTGSAGADLLKGRFLAPSTVDRVSGSERLSIGHDPVISANARSVAVPLPDGSGVLVFNLVAPGQSKRLKPRRQNWRIGLQPLAASFHGKGFSALLGDGEKVYFWQMSKGMGAQRPDPEVFDVRPPADGWMPCIRFLVNHVERLYVLDPAGRLVYWGRAAPAGSIHMTHSPTGTHSPPQGPMLLDTAVLGMVHTTGLRVLYGRVQAGQVMLCTMDEAGRGTPRSLGAAPAHGVAKLLFAGQGGWRQSGRVAVRRAGHPEEIWRIHAVEASIDPVETILEPGHRAVGLVHDGRHARYGLLTLAADNRSLSLCSRGANELLYTAPQEIARVSVCPNTGLVVLLTDRHQLICYSVTERTLRLFVDDTAGALDAAA